MTVRMFLWRGSAAKDGKPGGVTPGFQQIEATPITLKKNPRLVEVGLEK
jgi:hypothetical protein